MNNYYKNKAEFYLNKLCYEIKERTVGTLGNKTATEYFKDKLAALGWETHSSKFNAMDWDDNGAILKTNDNKHFKALVSPYSLGCDIQTELLEASTVTELEQLDAKGKIILLHGDIAKEQIMPKNFVFYNPVEHQQIVSLLEEKKPQALICATERCGSTAGGVYPFPLFEDGDFDIPSVYMTEEEGKLLLNETGKTILLKSTSLRINSEGYNVIGRKGNGEKNRIVITAHIDAKKGTPGAIDNATGIIILLLIAEMLKDYKGDNLIEIVALNGEDYYAVPGQMTYISENENKFGNILTNINIDGAGYKDGGTVFSYFNIETPFKDKIENIIAKYSEITEGIQWPQGDHSIFVQYGRPAIAVTSKWFLDNFCTQDVTHTPKDNSEIVDCEKLIYIAETLAEIINKI